MRSASWHPWEINGYHPQSEPKAVCMRLRNLPRITKNSGQGWNRCYCSEWSPFCSSRQTTEFTLSRMKDGPMHDAGVQHPSPSLQTACTAPRAPQHMAINCCAPSRRRTKLCRLTKNIKKPGCIRRNHQLTYSLPVTFVFQKVQNMGDRINYTRGCTHRGQEKSRHFRAQTGLRCCVTSLQIAFTLLQKSGHLAKQAIQSKW